MNHSDHFAALVARNIAVPSRAVVKAGVVVGNLIAVQVVDRRAGVRVPGLRVVPGVDGFGAAQHPEPAAVTPDVRMPVRRRHGALHVRVVVADVAVDEAVLVVEVTISSRNLSPA